MHFPFTPNHVQLIAACYPPNAALLISGSEYRPNSQELSRLTYYASNRPGKINKLSGELERRVRTDCRKAQAGNLRARASLLISLAIFKALAMECRRDISLLSSSLLASVNATLSALRSDLEVAARAASVFTAWTTYTDGRLIGVDRYIDSETTDHEVKHRTRLLGLTVVLGVVTSEALYHSASQFGPQISTIVPALIIPMLDVEVSILEHEAAAIKGQPLSPYLDGFRDKPALERRARSIHLHVDGDKGPSSSEVANTAIHALSILLGHSVAMQASVIMRAIFDCLDDIGGWEKVERCEWIATKAAEWTQYQYRYTIPSRLAEYLVEGQDAPHSIPRHRTLAAMLTTVFTSPTHLINLTMSDIMSSLIGVILRRIAIQADDPLIPLLVECIGSLGTHIYYTDQIQDLASELITRLVLVEANGLGTDKATNDRCRARALRCLLASLLGLIHAADKHDSGREDTTDDTRSRKAGTGSILSTPSTDIHIKPSRRTKVAPEIWQETLTLLCDADYSIRADYAEAVVSYLKYEVPKHGDHVDSDGVKRARPLAEGPARQANTLSSVLYGDSTTSFLHALHAHLYVLATSSVLGISEESPSSTPQRSENGDGANGGNREAPPESQDNSRRSTTVPPRSRKTSVMLQAIQSTSRSLSPSTSSEKSASLSDYANILAVLTAVQECTPVRGLLTGVPMLVALDKACSAETNTDSTYSQRVRVIKELLIRVWLSIGSIWRCTELIENAQKALESTNAVLRPPDFEECRPGAIRPPQQPISLSILDEKDTPDIHLNSEAMLNALASSVNIQEATGLDEQELLKRFKALWTPELILKDSMEMQTSYDSLRHDTISSLVKKAPTLMQIENMSLQSLTRSTRGGVGVTDLREALEGRSSLSNPNLSNRAPSLSTLEHTSTFAQGEPPLVRLTPVRSRPQQRSKLNSPSDVRDVLNKLGIGKQSGGNNLKPSFPFQKNESRPAIPPYKT
ncbi:unnamed protein product [Somion occarium]|uniref:Protein EFR3 n=1 Tax=Somion occarium TaxID=3059160 RepID=A0ABP1CZ48_9APHY